MAEALLIEGAKSVASTIIESLLKEAFSYLSSDLSSKLRHLETTILPQFQLMIKAAERSNKHKGELEQWLRKLKDARYEAEDTLDLYRYQLLKEKVSDLNTHPALGRFKKVARKVINTRLSILSPQKMKLIKSLNKLEKIANEAKTFRKLLGMQTEDVNTAPNLSIERPSNVTTSLPPSKVFGREGERDEIIDKYLLDQYEASEVGKNYSVVAIVGIGGAGKTTLAKLVYNDQRVAQHFDIKLWVCVSRKLDVFRHTREMIESSSIDECPHMENLDALQKWLANQIKLKKVLLVLDDVWCHKTVNEEDWENLLAPLATAGKRGSKILVTTRKDTLPMALQPQYSMQLRDLEENDIFSLFKHHAFGGTKSIDKHLQEELENIEKQIVQKLHRSPLATKAVGGQLSKNLETNFWRAALDRDNLCDTQQALIWSYQQLDAPLQHCFSYFSLFPKGSGYGAEDIVYRWIAEGFINSSNNSMRLEDIGKSYLDELVSGSSLQFEGYAFYIMHDLFHDLAENISKTDYLRIEDDQVEEIPSTIRHLYILEESLLENNMSFNKLENLRTLVIQGSTSSCAIDQMFAAIKKCKKLRVLDLSWTSIETLPKYIGYLKHLRYLNLEMTGVDDLPVELGKLYHLQVVSIYPYRATTFPTSVKNLINLRHFVGNNETPTTIPYMGRRLTSLQTLPKFHVKKEKGYDIGQLRDLNELRGSLSIENLENIERKEKAVEANLKNKNYLKSLELKWQNEEERDLDRRDLDREVLEGLRPHPNLTSLSIDGYTSPQYPNWLLRQGCLRNLRSLTFKNCTSLDVLPPIDDLFRHFESLTIEYLPNFRKFSSLPSCLKDFEISSFGSLVFVSKEEAEERREDIFGGKEKIELILPSTLQSLKIKSCDITEGALSQSLERLTSLESLELNHISTITTLPSEEILHHLISLTELKISFCSQLKLVEGLHALHSLKFLLFESCPCLEWEMVMPTGEGGGSGILPPSLQKLDITGCRSMKSFAVGAGDLPNLTSLRLCDCPSLASLSLSRLTPLEQLIIGDCPGILALPDYLPESLWSICIWGCPVLKERCGNPNGEDWPKIAHIRYKTIWNY
ncbi:disease resistance protein RGA2-like [Typha angustifolia]|uniref:disease resistance protein RGA2-like n=1 Tax=Typha angustifolia TaxID=59011 RepID=UPI003C2C4926